jgi:hypothetical protein
MAGKRGGKSNTTGAAAVMNTSQAVESGANNSNNTETLLINLITKMSDLLEKNYSLNDQVRQLREENKVFRDRQSDLLQRIEDLENGHTNWSAPSHNAIAPTDVQALVSSVSDELTQRKEKELNIVVYGLKEKPADENNPEEVESEEEVKQALADLFDTGVKCNVSADKINRAFRLGKPRRPDEKPRPIKVFMKDPDSRRSILENCKNLGKFPQDHKFRKVFVRADWTKLQREAYNRNNPRPAYPPAGPYGNGPGMMRRDLVPDTSTPVGPTHANRATNDDFADRG